MDGGRGHFSGIGHRRFLHLERHKCPKAGVLARSKDERIGR
jgi:hypothetical protein